MLQGLGHFLEYTDTGVLEKASEGILYGQKPEHSFVAGDMRQPSSHLWRTYGALHPAYSTLVEGRTGGGGKAYGLEDCGRLSDGERKTLAEIGQKPGKQALEAVATSVTPDTMLAWHRLQSPPTLQGQLL
jgi:hypothetical protein